MSLSKKDSVLRGQVLNFSTVLAANPTVYQQTAAVATQVTAAVDLYVESLDALTEARANGVRSAIMTATMPDNRQAMLNLLRPIYAFVQDSTSISDPAKTALGVHIRDTHNTPENPPGFAPLLSVVKVDGSLVTLRLRDAQEPDKRSRPAGVIGAALFSFIGNEEPVEIDAYQFQGNTGKTTADILLPSDLEPGTKVFFTAFWFNNRKESSPGATPCSTVINYPVTLPTTGT